MVAKMIEAALLLCVWMLYSDSKLLNAVWLAMWRLAVDTSIDGDDDGRPAPF